MGTEHRCIWCKRTSPEVQFNSVSHVLPEAVGNTNWILPRGTVCDQCNQYFGSKIEPGLLDDPLFHVRAVVVGSVDPEDMNAFRSTMFDATHPPVGNVVRDLHLDVKLHGQKLELGINYAIRGQLTREYSSRELAALSRAVHKIGFEALTCAVLSRNDEADRMDPFSPLFDHVRLWAREGQPPRPVRPIVRNMGNEINRDYGYRIWRFEEHVGAELTLFGDWYGVSLTSPLSAAKQHLWNWSGGTKRDNVWILGDSLHRPPT